MSQTGNGARLRSLDALRGFDMLVICGLDALVIALASAAGSPWLDVWKMEMRHAPWVGIRAYDLVFPLFVFLAGVSLAQAGGKGAGRIIGRVCALVALGWVYNGVLAFDFANQRWASVLGLIGVAYGIAAGICAGVRNNLARAGCAAGITAAVAVVQLWFPVPGGGMGTFTPEGIVNGWIDRVFLPGKLYGGTFDPEGILCCIAASAPCILGCAVGDRVKERGLRLTNVMILAIGGIILFAVGMLAWQAGYPPIKAAWTGTFVLLATGVCVVLFALFHLIVDFIPWHWSKPLEMVGANSLAAYFLVHIVPFQTVTLFFFGGAARFAGAWEGVVLSGGKLVLVWLVLWFLWRKKAFLRV